MSTKDKYHNIDTLLKPEGKKDTECDYTRKKRPSPAIGVMTGNKQPMRTIDVLKTEKETAEKALKSATSQFHQEKKDLLEQLRLAHAANEDTPPIVLTMPLTKQHVTFKLMRVDPSLIDVSPENERIQAFLDEVSLRDILSSIKKHGQQKPGTLRLKKDGRFELIEGSRRLAAVKLASQDYLALVGDVPDADVRELSVIENKHQDVSFYEKAQAYQRQIDRGEYANWTQLGASYGISSTHISRYKVCADLDEVFVRILPCSSDMPLSYGETIGGFLKKDKNEVFKKAREILGKRKIAAQEEVELPCVEEIVKILKSAVRTKPATPTEKKPVFYKSKNNVVSLKHSVSTKGNIKLELSGVTPEKADKILHFLRQVLKVE